jgi:hypothetical protein
MITTATILSVVSIVALGAFWPALKVHFDPVFAQRFFIPVLVIATANCFVLSEEIGWWTAGAYPISYIVGSALIGNFTQGKHLKTIVLDGGLWLIGIACIVLAASAIFL